MNPTTRPSARDLGSESARSSVLPPTAIRYFETFGYLKVPGLFHDDIPEIASALDEVLLRHAPSDGERTKRRMVHSAVELHDRLRAVRDDPRTVALVSGLLGADYEYVQSDASVYFKETSWHSDAQGRDVEPRIKLQLYLDPLTEARGAVRVLPGSHHREGRYPQLLRQQLQGALQHADRPEQSLGVRGSELPCHVLETQPGDALVWGYRLFHATFGETGARRALGINFRARTTDPDGISPG